MRDIYHDMSPYKVKEILLVSNLYDAFSINRDGKFSEIMLYDYGKLNLTSLPRITGVYSTEETFEQLELKDIDMVVVTIGFNLHRPLKIIKKIKERYPDLPIFILLNNTNHLTYLQKKQKEAGFDKIFVWDGESRIFFAMIKYLEDLKNAENDSRLASVRMILVVEDNPIFYSNYLNVLYKMVFRQTNKIIDEIKMDKLYKVLKLRARPKILLATNYEEAMELFKKYKDNIFVTITDVQFPKNGKIEPDTGFQLIDQIRKEKPQLPIVMLSSDKNQKDKADFENITFIDKNSEDLYQRLIEEVKQKIGFGDFVFKDKEGKPIAKATTLKEFEEVLKKVPQESIDYHARKDEFSLWLMARSEIQLAKILEAKKAHHFKDANDIRKYILNMLKKYRDEKPQGKVVPWEDADCNNDKNIFLLSDGAYGGKGRGLAFINSLLYKADLANSLKGLKIKMPKTAIIGADEFVRFIEENNLQDIKDKNLPDEEINKIFLKARLSNELVKKLDELLDCFVKPLAVRSSGLFEDSLTQPFAGIFETYIIPNNHPEKDLRLQQLIDAIKLVYASTFSNIAVNYAKALNHKLGDEKMSIVIQELVGREHNGLYYPDISGVAQSYNYYPFASMKPRDGFAVLAIGLGTYVVEGEKAFRFSPKYPKIQLSSMEDQIKQSQTYFYAVDLKNPNINLLDGPYSAIKKVDLYDAISHGTLNHLVSTYDYNNDTLYPGVDENGMLVTNFASILQNEYIPLPEMIQMVMDNLKQAFDTPVEIEFAVDLTPDEDGDATFYILQVKPLLIPTEDYSFKPENLDKERLILYAEKSMGNGKINTIKDIIFVKNENFDKTKTLEMAEEINKINQKFPDLKNYILIGPGRWGTRDRFIGIPVNWTHISKAKVIVETSLDGFPLDASSGSHFFHNLTTLNIAYFSVFLDRDPHAINYDLLNSAQVIEETKYFKHVRFDNPVEVIIDGKKRRGAVLKGKE
jgi:CheY-like chemotaxis protein